MIQLVAVKALAGYNYVRVDQVIAISANDPTKCNVIMSGGITIPCSEPAKDVLAKLEAASKEGEVASKEAKETAHGDVG
jgi:hypothetical protein